MKQREKMRFYTWKDVDRWLMLNKDIWEKKISHLEVYPSELIVTVKNTNAWQEAEEVLSKLLGNITDGKLALELGNESMEIIRREEDEDGEWQQSTQVMPLFKKVLYQDTAYCENMVYQELPGGVPVIAFHSYKGGVGRTLSLLAFAKAWSSLNSSQKLLIIDADMEAPGLTWLWESKEETEFSYLDLLEVIQSHAMAEEIADLVFDKMNKMTMVIETELMTAEHFFLPTYRYMEQLLDIYASPESIASSYNRKYLISEVLSKIGEKLGVAAVLVDLRAGISEFSAPILFDLRVKKYIVSSTSYQSIKGTELLLKQIFKGLPMTEETKFPEIFLSMVTGDVETGDIVSHIASVYDQGNRGYSITDDLVTELPFASELIHLESLSQIMKRLEERDFYKKIYHLVKNNYMNLSDNLVITVPDRKKVIEDIHDMARKQINAEGNIDFNILLTQPINYLIKRFEIIVPATVVMGAKGSGKTFLYREILKSQYWESFLGNLSQKKYKEKNILVVPQLAPTNIGEIQPCITASLKMYDSLIEEDSISASLYMDNGNQVRKFAREDHDRIAWIEFWQKLFLPSGFESFAQMDEKLGKVGKKVLFIIDGLEEILSHTLTKETERNAIAALSQDFINELRTNYKNIGCILFLRKDLARNSIEVNFEQFYTLYKSVELNWSKTEALRMVVWLVNQAVPGFYKEAVPIEKASSEVIERNLVRLWGMKLGKSTSNEAYSSRWILGALSDFNGQLQARDMIRFLQYATKDVGKSTYEDRYIMPAEIKKAVPDCSSEKISEIKEEIKELKPVLEKFQSAPTDKKKLPFYSNTFELNSKEELLLKQEGYLKIDHEKYYLPEIIRHALGFKYEKGARPKVLSLLLK